MITLNLPAVEQARAVRDALDTYMRLAIGQIDIITELVRFGTIPVGGRQGERVLASLEQIERVEALVNEIKVVLGYQRNGSNGIGNPHVAPSGHRAYEAMKVLAKAIALEQNPNPGFKGVDYDGLIVRYTLDPVPSASFGWPVPEDNGSTQAFNDAINFALDTSEGEAITFLEMWREGDWDGIAREFSRFDLSSSMASQVSPRTPQPAPDLTALRAFSQGVMEEWPMGYLDGGDLQALAVKHGLLKPEKRYEPCGVITGISTHDAAAYLIRESGESNESRRLVVCFEAARAASPNDQVALDAQKGGQKTP